MACAAPTVVLVLRLLMNSTAGYDVTLISVSVMGSEDWMACAAPTVVLVLRLVMNSTAGYDVTLISMSVFGFSLSVVCELFLKKISCFM